MQDAGSLCDISWSKKLTFVDAASHAYMVIRWSKGLLESDGPCRSLTTNRGSGWTFSFRIWTCQLREHSYNDIRYDRSRLYVDMYNMDRYTSHGYVLHSSMKVSTSVRSAYPYFRQHAVSPSVDLARRYVRKRS